MAENTDTAAGARTVCLNCGFEAPAGEAWATVDHPTLGTLTACPGCGSTDTTTR